MAELKSTPLKIAFICSSSDFTSAFFIAVSLSMPKLCLLNPPFHAIRSGPEQITAPGSVKPPGSIESKVFAAFVVHKK
jgi:hypothetical protein